MSDLIDIPFLATGGSVPSSVLQRLSEVVARMEGKRLIVTLKEQKRKRSLNQNNYYFGVLVKEITKVMRDVGNDMDESEVHEYLKDEVGKLSRIAVLPDGEVVKIKGSTKRLTTVEFEVYTEKVRAWGASMGIMLPLPNEHLTRDESMA